MSDTGGAFAGADAAPGEEGGDDQACAQSTEDGVVGTHSAQIGADALLQYERDEVMLQITRDIAHLEPKTQEQYLVMWNCITSGMPRQDLYGLCQRMQLVQNVEHVEYMFEKMLPVLKTLLETGEGVNLPSNDVLESIFGFTEKQQQFLKLMISFLQGRQDDLRMNVYTRELQALHAKLSGITRLMESIRAYSTLERNVDDRRFSECEMYYLAEKEKCLNEKEKKEQAVKKCEQLEEKLAALELENQALKERVREMEEAPIALYEEMDNFRRKMMKK